jgi:hypothetical protein
LNIYGEIDILVLHIVDYYKNQSIDCSGIKNLKGFFYGLDSS